jgi:2-C-methyl-D-erythritol 2,4-cyclodiphosphate synthase
VSTHCGIGYDIHQLAENRDLVLGGVKIPHALGLDGHSDADVLSHAIADALLGAVGAGDIGLHFPNTDESLRGISSIQILKRVAEIVRRQKGRPVNVDATLLAEAPKMAPHIPEMRKRISAAIGLDETRVSIKATTNETLGAIGRGEGIAAMAVASVEVE